MLMGRAIGARPSTQLESKKTKITPSDPKTKPPDVPAPRNRKEALTSTWWEGYHLAELEEMKSHEKNGTWKLIPPEEVPEGKTILKDRWAYADKLAPDGKSIERFKARLGDGVLSTARHRLQRNLRIGYDKQIIQNATSHL